MKGQRGRAQPGREGARESERARESGRARARARERGSERGRERERERERGREGGSERAREGGSERARERESEGESASASASERGHWRLSERAWSNTIDGLGQTRRPQVWNQTPRPQSEALHVPLYYTGLNSVARVSVRAPPRKSGPRAGARFAAACQRKHTVCTAEGVCGQQ